MSNPIFTAYAISAGAFIFLAFVSLRSTRSETETGFKRKKEHVLAALIHAGCSMAVAIAYLLQAPASLVH